MNDPQGLKDLKDIADAKGMWSTEAGEVYPKIS